MTGLTLLITELPKPMEGIMPKKMEEKLKKEGQAKGLTGKHLGAYIYGTLRKTGWKPSRKKGALKLLGG